MYFYQLSLGLIKYYALADTKTEAIELFKKFYTKDPKKCNDKTVKEIGDLFTFLDSCKFHIIGKEQDFDLCTNKVFGWSYS